MYVGGIDIYATHDNTESRAPRRLLVAALVALAACSSFTTSSTTPSPNSTASAATTATTATTATVPSTTEPPTTDAAATSVATTEVAVTQATTDAVATSVARTYPNGIRDVRYCEVLFLSQVNGNYVAEVWNTMGHSDCPQADWEALDAAALRKSKGSLLALLNGPRYWTMDEVDATVQLTAPVETFGTIEMFRAATVDLGPTSPAQSPFTERRVARDTVFRFKAGTEIYELTSADGTVYVMQSYSLAVDPTITADRLATLGSVLKLPTGWTYSSRVLDTELEVLDTDGIATVIQDALQNSYQRIDG